MLKLRADPHCTAMRRFPDGRGLLFANILARRQRLLNDRDHQLAIKKETREMTIRPPRSAREILVAWLAAFSTARELITGATILPGN